MDQKLISTIFIIFVSFALLELILELSLDFLLTCHVLFLSVSFVTMPINTDFCFIYSLASHMIQESAMSYHSHVPEHKVEKVICSVVYNDFILKLFIFSVSLDSECSDHLQLVFRLIQKGDSILLISCCLIFYPLIT